MPGDVAHPLSDDFAPMFGGRLPATRDDGAYVEFHTRDLHLRLLKHRRQLAKCGARLSFQKPHDHPHKCVVIQFKHGRAEIKWSKECGFYRYHYDYDYSVSGTRKLEKVLLRDILGATVEETAHTILDQAASDALRFGYRQVFGTVSRGRRSRRWLQVGAALASLGAAAAVWVYFWYSSGGF